MVLFPSSLWRFAELHPRMFPEIPSSHKTENKATKIDHLKSKQEKGHLSYADNWLNTKPRNKKTRKMGCTLSVSQMNANGITAYEPISAYTAGSSGHHLSSYPINTRHFNEPKWFVPNKDSDADITSVLLMCSDSNHEMYLDGRKLSPSNMYLFQCPASTDSNLDARVSYIELNLECFPRN